MDITTKFDIGERVRVNVDNKTVEAVISTVCLFERRKKTILQYCVTFDAPACDDIAVRALHNLLDYMWFDEDKLEKIQL